MRIAAAERGKKVSHRRRFIFNRKVVDITKWCTDKVEILWQQYGNHVENISFRIRALSIADLYIFIKAKNV